MLAGHVDVIDRNRVAGWAADLSAPDKAIDVEIYVNGEYCTRVSCNRARADLRGAGRWGAGDHGFRFVFASALSPELTHRIAVRFAANGQTVPNGEGVIPSIAHSDQLSPILIVAPGRSGTTLMMSRLSQCPQIVVADMSPFEVRLLSYYTTAYHVLTSTANFEQSMHPDHLEGNGYTVGFNPFSHEMYQAAFREKDLFIEFFRKFVPQEIGGVFKTIINEFYVRLKDQQDKRSATFFAEKSNNLDRRSVHFAKEAFSSVKEIVLIRDPRDIYCSHKDYFKSDKDKASRQISAASAKMLEIAAHPNADMIFVKYEDMI